MKKFNYILLDTRYICTPGSSDISIHVYDELGILDSVFVTDRYKSSIDKFFQDPAHSGIIVTVDFYYRSFDGSHFSVTKFKTEFYGVPSVLDKNDDLFLEDRMTSMFRSLPSYVRKKAIDKYPDLSKYQTNLDL